MASLDRPSLVKQYGAAGNLEARIHLHERFSTNRTGLHHWLFTQMDLAPTGRVLEVGCGLGTLWSMHRDQVSLGATMVLTDASPGMVQAARRHLAGSPPFTFAVADAQALPFPTGMFDAVLAHFMLYHVPDLPRSLAEIVRVLRPGGTLYAATNGRSHMAEARAFAARAGLLGGRALADGDAPGFSLENGQRQLAPWFPTVQMRRYEDSLEVTEPEPLVAYIRSGPDAQAKVERLSLAEAHDRIALLRSLLEHELKKHGVIRVSKESGMFVARTPG